MRSPRTTLPHVVVNRTPAGFIVVCTCRFTAERVYQVNADLLAWDHRRAHGTPLREQD